jgi:group II intron reverse transcriptase/maturase
VIRSILEPYYEAKFRDSSHGFRPDRGCHTDLARCKRKFKGANWFIEGDIKGCFDNIDHDVLINVLRESIDDERFLRLVRGMLEAGYLEEWTKHETLSGTPQGGVISPLFANIYLHKLDEFVENILQPQYTRGDKRRINPAYNRHTKAMFKAKAIEDAETWHRLKIEQRSIPACMARDDKFRRLNYVRYADDFILAFSGPKAEAEDIKGKIGDFLRETLKLELSEEKTLISHATTEPARFLGYDISVMKDDGKMIATSNALGTFRKRSINGLIKLSVPWEKVEEHCRNYMIDGTIRKRMDQMANEDFSIVAWYGIVFRGVAQYFSMAHDRAQKLKKLKYVMQTSMLKTLAAKHQTSVSAMAKQYGVSKVDMQTGKTLVAYEVVVERPDKSPLVATFGGFSLKRQDKGIIIEDQNSRNRNGRTEILERLMADKCENCGSTGDCEVHHVRKLADLLRRKQNRPGWVHMMILRSRKTLVLCQECHAALHAGRYKRR